MVYTFKNTFPYIISDLIKSSVVGSFSTYGYFHSIDEEINAWNDGGPELTVGCRVDGREIWGFRMIELWFGCTSLGFHIFICKIRSLNLMMILLALIFNNDDKFNAEQQSEGRTRLCPMSKSVLSYDAKLFWDAL